MEKKFMKGNEAIAEAAIRAGCRFFAGYPITPQNEIPEYMARMMPKVGGIFVQGESEIASINMVYGAAAAGARSMTSSSSPGISLKTEGISFLASAQLPSVIVSVMRGGPGLGEIRPAQQDYNQAVKAPGNGGFKTIVLAPSTIQEAVDLTYNAFDLADRDRCPVIILSDGCTGAMMEPVVLPPKKELENIEKDWTITGKGSRPRRIVRAFKDADPITLEKANIESEKMYKKWDREDVKVEEYLINDAEYILTAYGIAGRVAKTAVDELRKEGFKIGLIRPITLTPFPTESFKNIDTSKVKRVFSAEMSIPGQYIEDVRLALEGKVPLSFIGRSGGVVMEVSHVVDPIKDQIVKGGN